jgi:hypothetical protein
VDGVNEVGTPEHNSIQHQHEPVHVGDEVFAMNSGEEIDDRYMGMQARAGAQEQTPGGRSKSSGPAPAAATGQRLRAATSALSPLACGPCTSEAGQKPVRSWLRRAHSHHGPP